jgi:diaminohydroxyphosphoribosylaminopyrimidine deaminase / 5-amino-6-(5-phosphoribosylamino)uracil reductase
VIETAWTQDDLSWLREAVELSRRCPPSASAFSVGAILVGSGGTVLATGYSREREPHDHAEEVTLARVAEASGDGGILGGGVQGGGAQGGGLAGATMYTSLEPCRRRLSRSRSCSELIVAAGLQRVVLAWIEPPLFVPGGGAQWLADHGVTVIQIPGLAAEARAVNAHLLPAGPG